VSRSPSQKAPIKFHLCLELFVFLFLFLNEELDHQHMSNIITFGLSIAPPLGLVLNLFHDHLDHMVST
jgi:hypothetical protein